MGQCCQGAEISAAKLKKGRKKIWRGRESQGLNIHPIYQKRAEKGPNFFYSPVFHKIIYIYCQKPGL
jgi:hypothetical protein